MNSFGLASPKPEGMMVIYDERLEDGLPLPKLPNKSVCKGVVLAGKTLSRSEYTKVFIKTQKYF